MTCRHNSATFYHFTECLIQWYPMHYFLAYIGGFFMPIMRIVAHPGGCDILIPYNTYRYNSMENDQMMIRSRYVHLIMRRHTIRFTERHGSALRSMVVFHHRHELYAQGHPSYNLRQLPRWRHGKYADRVYASIRGEDRDERASLDEWESSQSERCETGDPTLELCTTSFGEDSIDIEEDTIERGAAVVTESPMKSPIGEAYDRGKWLVGLLILQSSSSFVLDSYQELIKEHLVVTLFLTMLVGAGGNAGNQSAIKVIRGMATGSIAPTLDSLTHVLQQQISVAFILGTSLSAAGWIRVYLTNGDVRNASAIALSLFLIVCTSVVVGTLLPFGLARAKLDPANAGTSIQVIMDCMGVLITCICCHYVLDTLAV